MKRRTFMAWWHNHHPLGSKFAYVRYAWLVCTVPLLMILLPLASLFFASIAFADNFYESMSDYVKSFKKAWIEAGDCKK